MEGVSCLLNLTITRKSKAIYKGRGEMEKIKKAKKTRKLTVKGDYNEDELTYTKRLCREQKKHTLFLRHPQWQFFGHVFGVIISHT